MSTYGHDAKSCQIIKPDYVFRYFKTADGTFQLKHIITVTRFDWYYYQKAWDGPMDDLYSPMDTQVYDEFANAIEDISNNFHDVNTP